MSFSAGRGEKSDALSKLVPTADSDDFLRTLFRSGSIYSILMLAMAKRKLPRFSATKAVKANARERVGQPKPARVVDTEPRTGREVKHKPKMEEIIRREE
jgi:hypothetical protein